MCALLVTAQMIKGPEVIESQVAIDAASAAGTKSLIGSGRGGGRFTNNTYAQHHWSCSWCNGLQSDEIVQIDDVVPASMLTIY